MGWTPNRKTDRTALRNIWNDPDAPTMLAEAWDRTQEMALEGSRQAALLATVLIAFVAQIKPATNDWRFGVGIVCLVLSVGASIGLHATNAFVQQRMLGHIMRAKYDRSESEPPAVSLAIAYLTRRKAYLGWLIAIQGVGISAGVGLLLRLTFG